MPFNQRQITKQAKFAHSPLGKAFEKPARTIEEQGRKQIDAITNQTEIFDGLVKEKIDEIKELTYEIEHDDLTYYFEANTAIKILMNSIMA